jgi:hypothetical protein
MTAFIYIHKYSIANYDPLIIIIKMIASHKTIHKATQLSLSYNRLRPIRKIKTTPILSQTLQRSGFRYIGAAFSTISEILFYQRPYLRGQSRYYLLYNACLIHQILKNSQELKINFLK